MHQGEILSGVLQLRVLLESLAPESVGLEFDEVTHPFVVVLTQECDLDWDFKARTLEDDENKRQLKLAPNVLLCELFSEPAIRPRFKGASDIWRRIINNQDHRYHQIPRAPPDADLLGQGLPVLIADFKQVLTIPTEELYYRLRFGLDLRRRTVIQAPWVQDLSNRFAYYAARVALPEGGLSPAALIPTTGARAEEPGLVRRLMRFVCGLLGSGEHQ